jgi:hypothetical protein
MEAEDMAEVVMDCWRVRVLPITSYYGSEKTMKYIPILYCKLTLIGLFSVVTQHLQ